jgi:shikimate dehydrogenase
MDARKFGVIGHPIEHSLSPLMHAASFKALGLPHTYEKFDVLPERVGDFIKKDAKEKDLSGINVTIPHKQNVIKHLDAVSREAELIGAVNTIKFGKKIEGYNTDGIGFVGSLHDESVGVRDNTFLVVGAGGAGRAITFQIALEGGYVTLASEFREDAENLSRSVLDKLDVEVPVITCTPEDISAALEDAAVLVNATPVGMHPKIDATILPGKMIPDDTVVVVDIVYNPVKTKLVTEAEARGLKTISGVGMLARQGAESERIWLGIEPPVKEMKDAVTKALSKSIK